jgi:hypothetical protein
VAGTVEYGQDFERMNRLKDRRSSDPYDKGPELVSAVYADLSVPGDLSTDSRLCLRFNGPGPATCDGFVVGHELVEKTT